MGHIFYLWVVHEVFECASGRVENEIATHKMAADFIFLEVEKSTPSLIPGCMNERTSSRLYTSFNTHKG